MWDIFNSNFFAAIVGAIVGGCITIVMQIAERRSAKTEKQKENRDTQRVVALGALQKLIRMDRQIQALVNHHERCLKDAHPGQEPWTYMRGVGAFPELSSFTTSEGTALLMLDADLFNRSLLYADRYQASLGAHALYSKERAELVLKLQPKSMRGIEGTVSVSPDLIRETAVRRAGLNEMVKRMVGPDQEDAKTGRDLIQDLVRLINSRLKMNLVAENMSKA